MKNKIFIGCRVLKNNKNIEYILKAASIILLVVGYFSNFRRWPRIWDITLWDESHFLATGIYNWNWQFESYEWSPLYSYIYHLAQSWFNSPVGLFYAVGLFCVIGSIIAIYLASWYISNNILFATLVGCILAVSEFAMIQPRAVYLAIVVLMIGAAISFRLRVFFVRCSILTLTTFLAAFIRPEFALGFYIFGVISVASFAYTISVKQYRNLIFKSHANELMTAVVAVMLIIFLSLKLPVPIVHGDQRAFFAFGQHFAVYWAQLNHESTFAWVNYQATIDTQFPGINTEFQAMINYPGKMIGFLLFNMFSIFEAAKKSILIIINQNIFFSMTVVFITTSVLIKKWDTVPIKNRNINNSIAPWYHDVILWLILIVPSLISVILIFAEAHYLLILSALLMIGIARVIRRYKVEQFTSLAFVLALVFCLSLHPKHEAPQLNLDVVHALEKQSYLGMMLENDGGWCIYLPNKCITRNALDIQNEKNFITYLKEENIDSIVVSDYLIDLAKSRGQTEFLNFISNTNPAGWEKIQLTPKFFLLRRTGQAVRFVGSMLTQNLMQYVVNQKLGDISGSLKDRGDMTLFIHPGITMPTTFDLKIGQLAHDFLCRTVVLSARMDPNIPTDAEKRGGTRVGFTILRGESIVYSQTVSIPVSSQFSLSPTENEMIQIKVDNHGNPDTDWFNLKISPSDCKM